MTNHQGVLFDESGHEYRVIELQKGQQLVYAQVWGEDDETYDGELRIVAESALHNSPPSQKLQAHIAELCNIRNELLAEIGTLRQELKSFESEANDRLAKLKQHKSLKLLEDYLAGRITHYVEIRSYGPPAIIALKDTTVDEGWSYREKLKLLSLFGRSDGNLEWGLNRYSDGSGCDSNVFPCTSYHEAIEVTKRLFAEHEKSALTTENRFSHEWVSQAEKYGITLTPEYLSRLEEEKTENKQRKIAQLQSQLRELQKT